MSHKVCLETIHVPRHVLRMERKRGFQSPWYDVLVTVCPSCGTEHRIRKTWTGPISFFGLVCGAAIDGST